MISVYVIFLRPILILFTFLVLGLTSRTIFHYVAKESVQARGPVERSLKPRSSPKLWTVSCLLPTAARGPGIEFRWRRYFPQPFVPALGCTQSPV
jgi:hypothetical protein